ncbi:hypothetical protein LTR35_017637 [Friedmanniomyces endolithicus]|uniref:Alcohol dehydrogenase-like N-terminal domain-containing protein n=1 Tax=Friedmanniomyces endolithicus TaxID=329885 RepID=A0A4U0TPS5_9PEZI|nr:hypothetical protein LTS09_018143 [Friedmanniomyces endolithicus]KAK0262761.1 hypothetical protein LTR35_017637 [Friedmanniomyces endolithicus]KAK0268798.1 hypothetical protein LTS00_017464 [Friedmanniomyces endolithicus]KAK0971967.1 hypothetical protein LTR54_017671 [Friedmanniomyces endolithicus]TKA24083.1 hypothetical protein B0A54_17837 [Friedmanniomyces endolithicus]
MKEAIVGPDLAAEVGDCPRLKPSRGDLLIKVACAGCNPKDWKAPYYTGKKANPGDDIAGEVAECGEDVVGFSVGDRVAAFHQMGTPGGAFAEYAIAPATTTFHLLIKVSFEGVWCNDSSGMSHCGYRIVSQPPTASTLVEVQQEDAALNLRWIHRDRRFRQASSEAYGSPTGGYVDIASHSN